MNNGFKWFYHVTPYVYELVNFLPETAYTDFLINLVRTRDIHYIVMTNTPDGYAALPRLKAALPYVHVTDILHTYEPFMFEKSVHAFPYVDALITVNPAIRDALARSGRVDMARVHMIEYGIDAYGMFEPSRYDRNSIRRQMQLPPDKKIVCWTGRLSPEKQPVQFLEMAARLKERDDVFFLLVGEGLQWTQVKEAMGRLHLLDVMCWLPGVPYEQIPQILAASDILVITSRTESGPLVLFEALAMNVPVVTYDVGRARDLIRDGWNGYVIPLQDSALLTEKVATLVADPRLLASMKEHCRTAILNGEFTNEQMVQKYNRFFQDWLFDK